MDRKRWVVNVGQSADIVPSILAIFVNEIDSKVGNDQTIHDVKVDDTDVMLDKGP